MDRLRALMDESCNVQLRRIEERLPDIMAKRDDSLIRPSEEACLRAAEVAVEEVEGNPGYYNARFYLRPHYQLEGVNVSLRLVSKLPSLKAA